MRMEAEGNAKSTVQRENERNECDRNQFRNLRGEKIWLHTHIKML